MTEVQKPRKVKELLKYPCEDYDIVVEIDHEEHNLDFLVDGSNNKIIFFYDYGDTIQQLKREIETLQEQLAHFDIGGVE